MIKIQMVTRLDFRNAVAGEAFDHRGQTYTVREAEGFRDMDGHRRMSVILSSRCATCGEVFTIEAGAFTGWLAKTCRTHRRSGGGQA